MTTLLDLLETMNADMPRVKREARVAGLSRARSRAHSRNTCGVPDGGIPEHADLLNADGRTGGVRDDGGRYDNY